MAGLTWSELMRPVKEEEEEKGSPHTVLPQHQHTGGTESQEGDTPQGEATAPPEEPSVEITPKRRGGRASRGVSLVNVKTGKTNYHAVWYAKHNYVRFCVPMPKPLRDILVAKSIRERIPTHKMVTNLLYEAVRGELSKPVGQARSAEELLGEGR